MSSSIAALSITPILSNLSKRVETWSIPLKDIYNNNDLRLDATHYDREAVLAVQTLRNSGRELKTLSELADVKLPGQFTRIWAKGPEHGYRYINASEFINLSGLGAIENEPRYLSKLTKTNIGNLIIHKGWLLVTCSGTIGRVLYVSERFEGWAATHDLIRVIPRNPKYLGYLHTFLDSPLALAQILGHTHGGQIDHITHHQLKTILVPLPSKEELNEYHKKAMAFLQTRDSSTVGLVNLSNTLTNTLKRNG